MKLQEIFNALTYGELSQISIGANADGTFPDKNYNMMLDHINLGLTELHKRFNLKTNTIEVILSPGRYRYHLHSDHKYSDEALGVGDFRFDLGEATLLTDLQPQVDPEFIRDQLYGEFQDDIVLITKVATPDERELPLNVRGNPWSVMTPKADTLEVPRRIVDKGVGLVDWLNTDRLHVTYRQGHPQLQPGAGQYDGNRVDIDLPQTHKQALLYFIASRVMNPIGMGQEFNAGNTYYTKFLQECGELELRGMQIDETADGDKLDSRGFV